jgi:SAM-dependent methyltransferase
MSGRWNHNVHYHRVVLEAVPPGCARALDVGCGQGALTRALRQVVPQVTGIDRDQRSIDIARAHPAADGIGYVLGDFLDAPFRPGSLDLVTAIASLHHMDAEAAFRAMSDLLRPGGVLAVIGLARGLSPADLYLQPAAVIGHRVHQAAAPRASARPAGGYQSPIVWPPPLTYGGTRRLAQRVLPGARFRRRVYWRYSLVWTKPLQPRHPVRRAAQRSGQRAGPGPLRGQPGGGGGDRRAGHGEAAARRVDGGAEAVQ